MAGLLSLRAGALVFALAIPACMQAQTTAQTTLYGVCSYKSGTTYYHTGVLTEPIAARNDVQHQFLLYINSQTPAAPKIGAGCRWSLTEAEVTKGLQLIEQSSSTKQAVIPWQYNPAASQTASARGLPTAQRTAAQPTAAQAAWAGGNQTAGGGTGTGGTGTDAGTSIGSIGSNTTNTLKGAGANASSTVAGSVNTLTTSGVNDMTNAATNAVGNLFHRKKKDASDATGGGAAGTTAGGASAAQANQLTASAATPAGAQPGAAAAADSLPAAGGVSFFSCHLKANGTAYYSEVFPAAATDQAPATMAFWREVAHQYKISNIPFSKNVVCDRAGSDTAAAAAMQAVKAADGKGVDTGWAYMGDVK